uniref:Uncharacterized protein n=1 Tax=Catharus ustulatus TaxID=91951 RepID=A0A8C3UQ50_CATUS
MCAEPGSPARTPRSALPPRQPLPSHPLEKKLPQLPGMKSRAVVAGTALGWREEQLWDAGNSSGMQGTALGCREQLWAGGNSSGLEGTALGWREQL